MILAIFTALCATLGAVFPAALASALPFPAAAGHSTEITVSVSGLRSSGGMVRACLTSDSDDFPKCTDPRDQHIVVKASPSVEFAFTGVKPGRYAIALLHDENGNGKMDRALLLMPKEGYGFSRDAPVRMGPPKFEAAAFSVGDEPIREAIRMRYMM